MFTMFYGYLVADGAFCRMLWFDVTSGVRFGKSYRVDGVNRGNWSDLVWSRRGRAAGGASVAMLRHAAHAAGATCRQ